MVVSNFCLLPLLRCDTSGGLLRSLADEVEAKVEGLGRGRAREVTYSIGGIPVPGRGVEKDCLASRVGWDDHCSGGLSCDENETERREGPGPKAEEVDDEAVGIRGGWRNGTVLGYVNGLDGMISSSNASSSSSSSRSIASSSSSLPFSCLSSSSSSSPSSSSSGSKPL
jgi:hypothetical protein